MLAVIYHPMRWMSVAQALETDDQENEVVLRKIQERMQR